MTPRQLETFRFIRDHIERTGESPTFTEIMAGIGARGPSQVHHLVTILVADGHLLRTAATKRGLRLPAQPPVPVLMAAFRLEGGELVERYRLTEVGWATA